MVEWCNIRLSRAKTLSGKVHTDYDREGEMADVIETSIVATPSELP